MTNLRHVRRAYRCALIRRTGLRRGNHFRLPVVQRSLAPPPPPRSGSQRCPLLYSSCPAGLCLVAAVQLAASARVGHQSRSRRCLSARGCGAGLPFALCSPVTACLLVFPEKELKSALSSRPAPAPARGSWPRPEGSLEQYSKRIQILGDLQSSFSCRGPGQATAGVMGEGKALDMVPAWSRSSLF